MNTVASAPFNTFDAIILGVLVLSAAIAFFRGFIREFLSLGAWVGAAVITIYLFPHSTEMLKSHVKNEHLAAGGAALGTYVVSLIVISIINSIIMRYVKTGMEVGLLDNFLGLIFGAFRGVFIVSLAYLIMMTAIQKNNPPEWLANSFTKEYLQKGADTLSNVAPTYLNDLEGIVRKEAANPKDSGNGAGETNYKPGDQKELDRLINSNTSQ